MAGTERGREGKLSMSNYIAFTLLTLSVCTVTIGGGWLVVKLENYLRGRKRGGQ
jgi:hypothetical protein